MAEPNKSLARRNKSRSFTVVDWIWMTHRLGDALVASRCRVVEARQQALQHREQFRGDDCPLVLLSTIRGSDSEGAAL